MFFLDTSNCMPLSDDFVFWHCGDKIFQVEWLKVGHIFKLFTFELVCG